METGGGIGRPKLSVRTFSPKLSRQMTPEGIQQSLGEVFILLLAAGSAGSSLPETSLGDWSRGLRIGSGNRRLLKHRCFSLWYCRFE